MFKGETARSLILGFLCVGLLACDDAPPPPTNLTCDVRQADCQERIARAVAEVRGMDDFDVPPVNLITPSEFRASLEAQVEDLTAEERRAFDRWGRALVLLGLLSSPDAIIDADIDAQVANVAAFYVRETQEVTVVDRGVPQTSPDAAYVFAHELTHYAQDLDETYGFAAHEPFPRILDELDALRYLIEGEAVVMGNLALERINARRLTQDDWDRYFSESLQSVQTSIADAADPYITARQLLPYVVGAQYVQQAHRSEGTPGVQALWTDPAPDTGSWMLGYGAEAGSDDVVDCEVPTTPAGYLVEDDDRLGAAQLFAMLVRAGVASERSVPSLWQDALGWRADHVRVYARDDADADAAPVGVAFRVRAATEAAAMAWEAALAFWLPAAELVREGQDILILSAEDPTVWADWQYPTECSGQPILMSASPAMPLRRVMARGGRAVAR